MHSCWSRIQACIWTVRCFTSVYIHTTDFGWHTEITLQDIPNQEYTLRLFVENVESKLQRKDDHTWTPALTVPISCLQSIQHATGACNRFLQVTPSGRILENADFHMGWWAHSAPCSTGGRGWGFAAVLPLAEKKKKKNTWTPAQCPYVPYFPNMYTQWWMCVYRDISPTSQIWVEVAITVNRGVVNMAL